MSRRGGGGGGRSATTGVRAIATALGIARHEIGSYTQVRKEPVELYPTLARQPLTLESTTELSYISELKQELLNRFHESPFYHKKAAKREVRRYTDKYRALNTNTFEPYWNRLPRELNWRAGRSTKPNPKRRKLDDDLVKKKLDKLARKEDESAKEDDTKEKDETDKEDEEDKNEDHEGEPLSDDDYLEEANDYVQSYFDNGDAYAECSDDNLDDGY